MPAPRCNAPLWMQGIIAKADSGEASVVQLMDVQPFKIVMWPLKFTWSRSTFFPPQPIALNQTPLDDNQRAWQPKPMTALLPPATTGAQRVGSHCACSMHAPSTPPPIGHTLPNTGCSKQGTMGVLHCVLGNSTAKRPTAHAEAGTARMPAPFQKTHQ